MLSEQQLRDDWAGGCASVSGLEAEEKEEDDGTKHRAGESAKLTAGL